MRPATIVPNPPAAEQPARYSPPVDAPDGDSERGYPRSGWMRAPGAAGRRQGTTAPKLLRIEPLEDRVSPGIIWGD